MSRTGTRRLMSFHLPFLAYLTEQIPDADILMGKPMPVEGARQFYQWHSRRATPGFSPSGQLQWLVDNNERLQQYQSLAHELDTFVNINLEIDIGLHRGGFSEIHTFKNALELIRHSEKLRLTGLMGYEAHITKIPALLGGSRKAFRNAMASYQQFVDALYEVMGEEAQQGLTLNTGGSTTYPLYEKPGLVNEIATASALVKPTDFDVFTLDHHLPAAFIATPVLKTVKNPQFPMASALSKGLRKLGLLPGKACFIYGGNWLAEPCFPEGAKKSKILGHSSNQEMYELSPDSSLKADDFFFFRPTQSEAVFLQFGNIAVYDNGQIIDRWPVFESLDFNG